MQNAPSQGPQDFQTTKPTGSLGYLTFGAAGSPSWGIRQPSALGIWKPWLWAGAICTVGLSRSCRPWKPWHHPRFPEVRLYSKDPGSYGVPGPIHMAGLLRAGYPGLLGSHSTCLWFMESSLNLMLPWNILGWINWHFQTTPSFIRKFPTNMISELGI